MKKISVITINYNNAEGLLRTIESVQKQKDKNYEFIIIDGGSKDLSTEVIKNNAAIISYWCSESDKGIYDAMNKGIEKAEGEYLIFLNSGDTLYNENVFTEFNRIALHSKKGIIYGDVNAIKDDKEIVILQNEKLEPYFWYKKTLNHQAAFIKKTLFIEFGKYPLAYKISSDFYFFLCVWLKRPEEFEYHHFIICNFYLDGFSQQKENFPLLIEEREKIYIELFPPKIHRKLYRQYRRTLPLKSRLLDYIYKRPLLDYFFKRVYKIYAAIKN